MPDSNAGPGQTRGRHGDVVAGTDLQRIPCQADDAIRVLAQQLRALRGSRAGLTPAQGGASCGLLPARAACSSNTLPVLRCMEAACPGG